MPPTEPLWATSLAEHRPPPEAGPEPEPAPPEREPEPPAHQGPPAGLPVLLAVAVIVLLGAVASTAGGAASASVREVGSYWGPIKLRCHTVRVDPKGRTAELFTCRSTGKQQVPEGTYAPPLSSWQSDIDRRHASDSRIHVDAGGHLTGWATY